MSALDELRKLQKPTDLETLVMWLGDKDFCKPEEVKLAESAAEELATLRARVAELEQAIVNYINDDSTRRDLRHEVEHLLP